MKKQPEQKKWEVNAIATKRQADMSYNSKDMQS